jgi:hypothetical protein
VWWQTIQFNGVRCYGFAAARLLQIRRCAGGVGNRINHAPLLSKSETKRNNCEAKDVTSGLWKNYRFNVNNLYS